MRIQCRWHNGRERVRDREHSTLQSTRKQRCSFHFWLASTLVAIVALAPAGTSVSYFIGHARDLRLRSQDLQRGLQPSQVMVTVPHRMILKDELTRQHSIAVRWYGSCT